jgi:putative peptidoglycan lipid II flippase
MLATVSLASIGLLALALGLLALLTPICLPLLSMGFGPDARELSLRLSYLVLPCVLLSGAATLWSAVLNAHDQFAIAEISEVAVPLCMIFGVVLGGVRYGVYSLAIGYVIGYALQLTLLTVSLWKKRLLIVPRWYGWDADVRLVVSQYLPVLGGGLLLGTAPLIDQAMAASLGAGSVASLGYGTKVVGLVLMVGSISVSRAVLPAFSRMVAAWDYGAVRQTLRLYTRLILIVGVPVTIGLIIVSEPTTRLIFERGAFTAEDTGRVAVIQTMSALQIPFYILAMLYVRLISAIRANHILLIGTAISFVINLSMDYYLKEVMGVAGIALSTTLVYVVSLCFLGVMLFRRLRTEGNA